MAALQRVLALQRATDLPRHGVHQGHLGVVEKARQTRIQRQGADHLFAQGQRRHQRAAHIPGVEHAHPRLHRRIFAAIVDHLHRQAADGPTAGPAAMQAFGMRRDLQPGDEGFGVSAGHRGGTHALRFGVQQANPGMGEIALADANVANRLKQLATLGTAHQGHADAAESGVQTGHGLQMAVLAVHRFLQGLLVAVQLQHLVQQNALAQQPRQRGELVQIQPGLGQPRQEMRLTALVSAHHPHQPHAQLAHQAPLLHHAPGGAAAHRTGQHPLAILQQGVHQGVDAARQALAQQRQRVRAFQRVPVKLLAQSLLARQQERSMDGKLRHMIRPNPDKTAHAIQ